MMLAPSLQNGSRNGQPAAILVPLVLKIVKPYSQASQAHTSQNSTYLPQAAIRSSRKNSSFFDSSKVRRNYPKPWLPSSTAAAAIFQQPKGFPYSVSYEVTDALSEAVHSFKFKQQQHQQARQRSPIPTPAATNRAPMAQQDLLTPAPETQVKSARSKSADMNVQTYYTDFVPPWKRRQYLQDGEDGLKSQSGSGSSGEDGATPSASATNERTPPASKKSSFKLKKVISKFKKAKTIFGISRNYPKPWLNSNRTPSTPGSNSRKQSFSRLSKSKSKLRAEAIVKDLSALDWDANWFKTEAAVTQAERVPRNRVVVSNQLTGSFLEHDLTFDGAIKGMMRENVRYVDRFYADRSKNDVDVNISKVHVAANKLDSDSKVDPNSVKKQKCLKSSPNPASAAMKKSLIPLVIKKGGFHGQQQFGTTSGASSSLNEDEGGTSEQSGTAYESSSSLFELASESEHDRSTPNPSAANANISQDVRSVMTKFTQQVCSEIDSDRPVKRIAVKSQSPKSTSKLPLVLLRRLMTKTSSIKRSKTKKKQALNPISEQSHDEDVRTKPKPAIESDAELPDEKAPLEPVVTLSYTVVPHGEETGQFKKVFSNGTEKRIQPNTNSATVKAIVFSSLDLKNARAALDLTKSGDSATDADKRVHGEGEALGTDTDATVAVKLCSTPTNSVDEGTIINTMQVEQNGNDNNNNFDALEKKEKQENEPKPIRPVIDSTSYTICAHPFPTIFKSSRLPKSYHRRKKY